jgi:hypothetical protein
MRRRCPSIRIAQKSFYLEPLQARERIAKPLAKFLSSLDDDNKGVAAVFHCQIRQHEKNGLIRSRRCAAVAGIIAYQRLIHDPPPP